jgi:calcium-dependent protein kinase
MIIQ